MDRPARRPPLSSTHTEFGKTGAIAISCFLIMSATALNRRWLNMEQMAFTSSERLPDMTSQYGDSFLDELCTMSCNVQQVVEAIELCVEVGGALVKGETMLFCAGYHCHMHTAPWSALRCNSAV